MRRGLAAATLIGSIALTIPASAGEPTEMLRTLFERANQVLSASDVTADARVTALRLLVGDAFDAREAAALALGREWMARSAAERDEFSRLFGDLIESAYLGGVGSRARVHADGIRVAFDSELVQGRSATVRTTLETRDGGAVPVEYRLIRGDRGWAVIDVAVEGVGLAGSYRAQIQRVMQSGTYAELVARLREKASTATLAAIAAARSAAAAINPVVSEPSNTTPPALEPPRPSEAAPPVSPLLRSFWVQVGAFRDPDAASRLVERLRNHSVMVATGGGHSEPLARVLVGPFANRPAAIAILRELAAGGYRAFIAVE
jgi:phospholipid transport system substrate-binding protein